MKALMVYFGTDLCHRINEVPVDVNCLRQNELITLSGLLTAVWVNSCQPL